MCASLLSLMHLMALPPRENHMARICREGTSAMRYRLHKRRTRLHTHVERDSSVQSVLHHMCMIIVEIIALTTTYLSSFNVVGVYLSSLHLPSKLGLLNTKPIDNHLFALATTPLALDSTHYDYPALKASLTTLASLYAQGGSYHPEYSLRGFWGMHLVPPEFLRI